MNKTLFGFISDGLRSLLETTNLNSVVEYTLRYRKHFEKVKLLKEDGFLDPDNVENTSKVLFEKWKMTDKIKDFSLLEVTGLGAGKVKHKVMYDEHDGEFPGFGKGGPGQGGRPGGRGGMMFGGK